MLFKESRFNMFLDWDDQTVVGFNSSTAATVSLTKESFDQFRQAADNGTLTSLSLLWQYELLHLGFIVPESMDELAAMQAVSTYAQNATHGLGLTICPTMDCNLACTYCYQGLDKENKPMSPEIYRLLPGFVEEHMPPESVLQLHWYGGEPLLERELVMHITEQLHNTATEQGSHFRLSIVTNGTLLDQEIVDFLESHNLEGVQVTMDGPRHIHDERKPLLGGGSSFDTILERISSVKFQEASLAIRVNVDDMNFQTLPELLSVLEQHVPHASVNPAPVVRGVSICKDAADHCIDNEKFAELEAGFLKMLWNSDTKTGERPFVPRTYHCGAQSMRAFTIDPEGYLYKCWNYPGHPESAVGHLALPVDVARSAEWLNTTPYSDEQCRECTFLPLCHGGCPYQLQVNKTKVCDRRKYYLRHLLGRRIGQVDQQSEVTPA